MRNKLDIHDRSLVPRPTPKKRMDDITATSRIRSCWESGSGYETTLYPWTMGYRNLRRWKTELASGGTTEKWIAYLFQQARSQAWGGGGGGGGGEGQSMAQWTQADSRVTRDL